jgi:hypothetical protein
MNLYKNPWTGYFTAFAAAFFAAGLEITQWPYILTGFLMILVYGNLVKARTWAEDMPRWCIDNFHTNMCEVSKCPPECDALGNDCLGRWVAIGPENDLRVKWQCECTNNEA